MTSNNPEIAAFWSDAQRLPGVKYCGYFHDRYGRRTGGSGPIDDSNPPADLYEVVTEEGADNINRLAHSWDQGPWWRQLLAKLLSGPPSWGGIATAVLENALRYDEANAAEFKFWHDHHFTVGDRIYLASSVNTSGGVTMARGLSFLNVCYARLAQHGGSFTHEEMLRTDHHYQATPDPRPYPPSVRIGYLLSQPVDRHEDIGFRRWTAPAIVGAVVHLSALSAPTDFREDRRFGLSIDGYIFHLHSRLFVVCQDGQTSENTKLTLWPHPGEGNLNKFSFRNGGLFHEGSQKYVATSLNQADYTRDLILTSINRHTVWSDDPGPEQGGWPEQGGG